MVFWIGGRVVEGARLESVYSVWNGIVGSNPTLSASLLNNVEFNKLLINNKIKQKSIKN